MSQTKRFHTKADIPVDEIAADREDELRTAFNATEYGERIQQCIAASFEIDEPIDKSGIVISSWLHHERIFDLVGSFASAKGEQDGGVTASATVKDVKTGEKLSAHVTEDRILVSLRDEDVSFESFAAYVLFLEQNLHVKLSPILE